MCTFKSLSLWSRQLRLFIGTMTERSFEPVHPFCWQPKLRFSRDGQIPSVEDHVAKIAELYEALWFPNACRSINRLPCHLVTLSPCSELSIPQRHEEGTLKSLKWVASREETIQRRRSSDVRIGDSQDSPPWRLTLDTNPDDCNLHCDMCEGFSQYSTVEAERRSQGLSPRRMPMDLAQKVLREFVDLNLAWLKKGRSQVLEVIPSTMGEPLLYQHFEKLLELISEEDARLKAAGHDFGLKLNLTTNGTFPRLGARRWAELLLPLTSDIKISWNGAQKETQETIMKGHDFEKVMENVKILVQERDALVAAGGPVCRLTFQLTFLEDRTQRSWGAKLGFILQVRPVDLSIPL